MATTGDQKTATATLFQGASYNWTIQNGTFTSGTTSNSVTFAVGDPGTLTLGCTAEIGSTNLSASAPMKVLPLPVINSFTAAPASISTGENVKLTANFTNGVGTIQPGNLAITSGVPISVSPTVTTIYTLNDTNAAGGNAVFATLVTVGASSPVVVTAPANVTTSQSGYTASVPSQAGYTYAWMITNGTIAAGATTNQITFTAGASGTVQLACTLTSADNSTSQLGTATLTIVAADTTPVITTSANVSAGATGLTASVQAQANSSYAWTITNGAITAGGGTNTITFTAGTSGSVLLSCTVSNAAGTASTPGTATLTVVPLPTISSFVASPLTVKPGQGSTLSWSVSGAASLSIDQAVGAVTGSSIVVTPTISTTYTLTATNSTGTSTNASVEVSVTATGQSVYVGGFFETVPEITGYWLNGNWVNLSLPSGSNYGSFGSLVLSGSDIYAAGGTSNGSNNIPGYWLNGTWVGLPLPSGLSSGIASSLVVSENNVYVAGFGQNGSNILPGYWFNGVWVGLPLPSGSSSIGETNLSLVVSGDNVYVAGSPAMNSGCIPGYWLNGTWIDLPLPSGSSSGHANVLVLSGSDVYVAGSANSLGYWLNGTWIDLPLPSGSSGGAVTGLVVSGNNVYVAGSIVMNSEYIPGYWLNGTWIDLPLPSGSSGGAATALVVSGSDVYVAGDANSGSSSVPGYWLNGTWIGLLLPPGSGSNPGLTTSIVVQ
jgi:hypothetical protein